MKKEKRRELFKSLRQETGLSQGKLATLMGLGDRRRIHQLETGGGQDRAPAKYHLRHVLAIKILHKNDLLDDYTESCF
jgi:transcriptional regulator with XRE-family HTH domain